MVQYHFGWPACLDLLSDDVQTFKARITIYKVLQEDHPNVRPRSKVNPCPPLFIFLKYRPLRKLMDRRDDSRLLVSFLATASEDRDL